jgi:hypothetical protein
MATYLTKFHKKALVTIRNKLLSTLLKYSWTTGRHLFLIVGSPYGPSYLALFLKCAWMSSISHHSVTNDNKVQATSQNFQVCSDNHLFLTIKSKCRATLGGSHFFNFPLTSRKVVVISSVGWVFVCFGNSWVWAFENKNFKE